MKTSSSSSTVCAAARDSGASPRLPYIRPGEGEAPVELCCITPDGYHVFPLTVARAAALAADLAQAVAREMTKGKGTTTHKDVPP